MVTAISKSTRTPESPGRRKASALARLPLALYAAGVILGAGVFNLPFELPHVGLVPMILLLTVMGIASVTLIPRLVYQGGSESSGLSAEADVLASAVTRTGGGKAGIVLAFLGAKFYVIPATIGYTTIGMTALAIMANVILSGANPGAVAFSTAVASVLIMGKPKTPALVKTICGLTVRWMAGVYVVHAFNADGLARQVVFLTAFVAGVLYLMDRDEDTPNGRSSHLEALKPEHGKNVATLIVQLALMATLAVFVVIAVALQGDITMPPLFATPSFSAAVTTLGVALFAFTGTGFQNVSGYSPMKTSDGARAIVSMSIGIVLVVQIAWLVAAGLTVNAASLLDLNASGSYSSVAMANAITGVPSYIVDLVQIMAAVLVLFAVSGAANGFTETLMREYSRSASTLANMRTIDPDRGQKWIVIAAGAASILTSALGVPINTVLAAAGLAGGVVIMFALPLLAEPDRELRHRRGFAAVIVVVAISGLGIVQSVTSGAGLAGIIVTSVPCGAVLLATALTARNVAASATSPDLHPVDGTKGN